MELLDAVLIVTDCENTEELKKLSAESKRRLADALEERVPSDLATIEEWNELLMIFMDTHPEKKNKTAKKKLLCYLRNEEDEQRSVLTSKSKWWQFKQ